MNNTTKQKYDVATRMLKGKIDVEEVALMTGLPIDELNKLKEDVVPNNTDAEILKNLDNVDLDIGELLYDNLPAEDLDAEGFREDDEDTV